jgi:hypothetical protein
VRAEAAWLVISPDLTIQPCHVWHQRPGHRLRDSLDPRLRVLYAGPDGWRLAPAYDLNPVPIDIKPRVLTTAIDLDAATANAIVAEVGQATVAWRTVAADLDLSSSETDRMASAFEHQDLQAALNPRPRARKTRR